MPAREIRRAQVLEAALELIAERGLELTRMSDISLRTGMSAGHVLYYFQSKSNLLMNALRWVEDRVDEAAQIAIADAPDAPSRLARVVEGNLPEGVGDPRWMLWLEAWTLAPHDPEVSNLTAELDARWVGLLADIARRGVDAAEFTCEDPENFAVRFSALFDGLSVQVVTGAHARTREAAFRECMRTAAIELGFATAVV